MRLTPSGLDKVELLIAPNPGEPPRPLRRIASGGELSRALLGTKRVLAGIGPVGTYVFDEVDSGVGGAVADAIGRKLAEVARHHQVICITHLPQIAAFGRFAHGREQGGDGRADREPAAASGGPRDRVEELARMLGGRRVTDAARGGGAGPARAERLTSPLGEVSPIPQGVDYWGPPASRTPDPGEPCRAQESRCRTPRQPTDRRSPPRPGLPTIPGSWCCSATPRPTGRG